jgi:hypothetical protein
MRLVANVELSELNMEPSGRTGYDYIEAGSTTYSTSNLRFWAGVSTNLMQDVKLSTYTGEARWIVSRPFPLIITSTTSLGFGASWVRYSFNSLSHEGIVVSTSSSEGPWSLDYKAFDLSRELDALSSRGLLKKEDLVQIIQQRSIVEQKRSELLQYRGKVLVACGGELFLGDTLEEALAKARKKYGDKPYYAENLGTVMFPSVYEW